MSSIFAQQPYHFFKLQDELAQVHKSKENAIYCIQNDTVLVDSDGRLHSPGLAGRPGGECLSVLHIIFKTCFALIPTVQWQHSRSVIVTGTHLTQMYTPSRLSC